MVAGDVSGSGIKSGAEVSLLLDSDNNGSSVFVHSAGAKPELEFEETS